MEFALAPRAPLTMPVKAESEGETSFARAGSHTALISQSLLPGFYSGNANMDPQRRRHATTRKDSVRLLGPTSSRRATRLACDKLERRRYSTSIGKVVFIGDDLYRIGGAALYFSQSTSSMCLNYAVDLRSLTTHEITRVA